MRFRPSIHHILFCRSCKLSYRMQPRQPSKRSTSPSVSLRISRNISSSVCSYCVPCAATAAVGCCVGRLWLWRLQRHFPSSMNFTNHLCLAEPHHPGIRCLTHLAPQLHRSQCGTGFGHAKGRQPAIRPPQPDDVGLPLMIEEFKASA